MQTDATLLAYNSQHSWELLRPFVRSVRTICIGPTCIEMFVITIIIIIIIIIIIVIVIISIIIIFFTDYLRKGPEENDAFEVDQA